MVQNWLRALVLCLTIFNRFAARVRKECPQGTRVRSVEIDARVAGVASKYFGLELE